MTRTLTILAFLFVLWLTLSPQEPQYPVQAQVSAGIEAAAIRIVKERFPQ